MVLARIQFRLNFNLTKKASNNLPDTLQTQSRHYTDTLQTFQTPSMNLLLHFHTTKRCWSQISSNPSGGWVGGVWVVVYRYIIMPLRCPTCKMVLARIQFPLNSKLDPSVAKCRRDLRVYLLNRVYPYLIGWRSFQGCLIGSGYCNQHNVRVTREVNPKRMSSRDKNGEV